MQNTKFNQELQQHARGYRVSPSVSAFDKVMAKRENEKRRKRVMLVWVAAAAVIGIASLFYVSVFLEKTPSAQPYVLASTENTHLTPIISRPIQNQKSHIDKPNTPTSSSFFTKPNRSNKSKLTNPTENKTYFLIEENKRPTVFSSSIKNTKRLEDKPLVLPPSTNLIHTDNGQTALVTKNENSITSLEAKAKSSNVLLSLEENTTGGSATPTSENKQTVTLQPPIESAIGEKVVANLTPTSDSNFNTNPIVQNIKSDSIRQNLTNANTVSIPKGNKWAISALFTPQFINSVYSANSSADLAWFNNYYDNKKKNDQSRFSYNAGIKIERQLNKRFSLSSGVLLSVIKFDELSITVDTMVVQHPGLITTTSTITTYDRNRFDISFTSLEFPLLVNYNIHRNKISYQLNTGLSYAYLIATRSLVFNNADTLNAKETNDAQNNRLQQHHLILICGANIAYHITHNWSMYAGPVFRYQLNSLYSKDYVIRQNPYYAGVEVGVKYSF